MGWQPRNRVFHRGALPLTHGVSALSPASWPAWALRDAAKSLRAVGRVQNQRNEPAPVIEREGYTKWALGRFFLSSRFSTLPDETPWGWPVYRTPKPQINPIFQRHGCEPRWKRAKARLADEVRAKTTVPLVWIAERLRMGSRGYLTWLLYRYGKATNRRYANTIN